MLFEFEDGGRKPQKEEAMLYENETFENLQLEGDTAEELIFSDCIFSKCKFYEMKVRHCSFRSCTFRDCTILNSDFKFTDAADNRFEHCSVVGMAWNDVERENKIMLPFSTFVDCTLKHNLFVGFKMKKFCFDDCDLQGSSFQQCDLLGASFRRTGLRDASFQQNNLIESDFRDASDYNISLENNKLKKARFSFPDAIRLLAATGIIVE